MNRPFLARQILKVAVWLHPPVGDVRPMPELVILTSRRQAEVLGFDLRTMRHREHRHMTGWVLGDSERSLRGRTFGRVTVEGYAGRRLTHEQRDLIRSRMAVWRATAVWLEF